MEGGKWKAGWFVKVKENVKVRESESGRNTQGVYIVRLQKGDRLQGVARVVETDDEEAEGELPLGA